MGVRKSLRALCAAILFVLGSIAFASETTTYTYDALGRLFVVSVADGPKSGEGTVINHDAAGNRLNYSVGEGLSTTSFMINDTSTAEGNTLTFTITKIGPDAASVTYATADQTATAPSDYTPIEPISIPFTAEESEKTIVITTIGDSTPEPDETMVINLSNPTGGATIFDVQGVGTINNDDVAAPVFKITGPPAVTVEEGGSLIFTVTKENPGAASVNYSTADWNATGGSDYVVSSGTLTFGSEETTKTITIETLDDSTVDPNVEYFYVNLSGATGGAVIAQGQAIGGMLDNETTVGVTRADAVREGSSLIFMVRKRGSDPVTVDYATVNGTATAGADYTATSGTLTFAAGSSYQTISVPTSTDAAIEGDETLIFALSNPSAGAQISSAQSIGKIKDPASSFAISDAAPVAEGGALSFTVTKTGTEPAQLTYWTVAGTATTSDYNPPQGNPSVGSISFTAAETSKTITITTNQDTTVEPTETFSVVLSALGTDAIITDGQGTGTILDDDVTPQVSISDATATEGGLLTFTISKTGSGEVQVSFATADGSATAGADYQSKSNSVTLFNGDQSKTITVSTTQDTTYEGPETVLVNLTSASEGAIISDGQGVGTINDDDPDATFAIGDVTAIEGSALVYNVTKTGPGAASVNFASANGTASAGSDYTADSGTLNFASGDTSKTVTIATINDTAVESSETVKVNLSGATNGADISDSQGTGTIIDNDGPRVSVSDPQFEEGGYLSFVVTRSGPAAAFSVDYATSNGTAVAGTDYTAKSGTLSFASGDTSKTVQVFTTSDTLAEPDETILFTLSGATNGVSIEDASGVGTILDDDTTRISVGDKSFSEGGFLTFQISRSGPGLAFSVNYATADGTAVAGSDYTAKSGAASFLSGDTSKSVQVDTIEDTLVEPNETFLFNISGTTNGVVISDSSATGTITNDD